MGLTQEQQVFFLGAGSISEAIIKGIVGARLLPPRADYCLQPRTLCTLRGTS